MKKITLILLSFILANLNVHAQNDGQISNFMFNKLSYNPAFAGSTNTIDLSVLARQQWVAFKNGPLSQYLNFDSFISKTGGIGLSVINDKLGYEKSVNAKICYSYPMRLKMSKKSIISAGVSAGILNKSLDGTKLIFDDEDEDPSFTTLTSEYKLDLGLGLMYTNQTLTIGVSSTHINQSNNKSSFFNVPRHFYLYSSYIIKPNDKISIVPALFVKSTMYINQYELNTNVFYAQLFWGGISYRLNESIIFLAGFVVNKYIKLAYSYDCNIGSIKSFSDGSHEIMILTSFGKYKKSRNYFKSPRYLI
jgi:type IX secretion system PorP/SprF family membrane protein